MNDSATGQAMAVIDGVVICIVISSPPPEGNFITTTKNIATSSI